jgi:uncharacterized protein (TIGR02231 family)
MSEDDEHVHARILGQASPRLASTAVQPQRPHLVADNDKGEAMNLHSLAHAAGATLLSLAACEATAQETTRIVGATVYPDSARVERELKVPGGTRHIVLACVPGGVDVTTLQVDGDPELHVGEIHTTPLPATRWSECMASPLEARGRALDAKRESLEAQRDANELALSYLKVWGSTAHADDRAGTPAPAPAAPVGKTAARAAGAPRPGVLAADLHQAAFDVLVDQARVKRELLALEREDARLDDAAPPSRGKDGGWRTVRFDAWTPAAASLRVHYNVINAYWRPTYRATLDTARATLRIDRQADIVQGSGEDWGDVRVRLSTGRVNRAAQAQLPQSWFLDVVVPRPVGSLAFAALAAPVSAEQRVEVTGSSIRFDRPVAPPWGTTAVATDYATEFDVSQVATLPSDGETHTLQLASQTVAATLKRRVTPRTDHAVYLLAEAPRPAGAWPAGPLQSWVDGALVGRMQWQPALGDKLLVALGQDDQMHIDVESPGAFTQSKGVFGGSVERTSTAVYAIVNQHTSAVMVEMLDAAPVSRNEAIQVSHAYVPQPSAVDWNKLPGVAEWTLVIPAQDTRRVSISHSVTAPKETVVSDLP